MKMISHEIQSFPQLLQHSRDHEHISTPQELPNHSRHSSRPALTPYRAHPIQSQNSHWQALLPGVIPPTSGRTSASEEYMLRRKTPIGTIAAGYDGSIQDWSCKLPASKHVLLPLLKVFQKNEATKFCSGIQDKCTNRDDGGINITEVDEAFFSQKNEIAGTSPLWMHGASASTPSYSSPGNCRDYTLIQVPYLNASAYQTLPKQSYSNKNILSYSSLVDYPVNSHRPTGYELLSDDPQTTSYKFHENVNQQPPNFLHASTTQPTSIGYPSEISDRSSGSIGHAGNRMSRETELSKSIKTHAAPHPRQHKLNPATSTRNFDTSDIKLMDYTSDSCFLKKTLTWANDAYNYLLVYLYQSHAEENSSKQSIDVHKSSNSQKHPQILRQFDSGSAHLHWQNTFATKDILSESYGSQKKAVPSGPISNTRNKDTKVAQLKPMTSNPDYPFTSTENTSSITSRSHQLSLNMHGSPLNSANEAMSILAELCAQSGWQWVDGMLLGGCIAHGLKEYHKAIEWFSKILSQDSK